MTPPKLGRTEDFPRGRLNKHDEGGLFGARLESIDEDLADIVRLLEGGSV